MGKYFFLIHLSPHRAPGCSPAAEERMQRGAGEVTGQFEGCGDQLLLVVLYRQQN